jgi:murein DD-endopeptidase MepM/ murein hydrolase activator NlpD
VQKNNNNYTFLLSHSSKSSIYIRKIEVSKNVLHTTSFASLFLIIGIVSFGLLGFVEDTTLAKSNIIAPDAAIISQQTSLVQNNQTEDEPKINSYENSASTVNDYSINSGGPLTSYQLTESEDEAKALEIELRRIEATSSQEFIPRMWAHLGKINNEFGYRRNPFGGGYEFHGGMDIDGERGDSILAPANGVVIKAEWQGGYGNMIEIDHGNGLTTRYGHLAKIEIQAGDMVQRGQLIGFVGSTGRSTGPHLHYELRLNDKTINPRRFLPPEPLEMTQLTKK